MGTSIQSRGISKAQWLETGLKTLSKQGAAGLSVEGLARTLGIARAGFYWHFKDREDLLQQLLEHWVTETTEVVTKNRELSALEPGVRLATAAEMILERDLGRYDMAIRQWALNNARAARAVRQVNRIRADFVRSAFSELGFTGDDLDMRTMLFIGYHSTESTVFREITRKRRRELIAKRMKLLTSR